MMSCHSNKRVTKATAHHYHITVLAHAGPWERGAPEVSLGGPKLASASLLVFKYRKKIKRKKSSHGFHDLHPSTATALGDTRTLWELPHPTFPFPSEVLSFPHFTHGKTESGEGKTWAVKSLCLHCSVVATPLCCFTDSVLKSLPYPAILGLQTRLDHHLTITLWPNRKLETFGDSAATCRTYDSWDMGTHSGFLR